MTVTELYSRKKAQKAQKRKAPDLSDVRIGRPERSVPSRFGSYRAGWSARWRLPVSALVLIVPFCGYLCSSASAQEVPDEFGNPWMANLVELENPPPVPWWPPAPGWYVVATLVCLALLYLAWRGHRRWHSKAYRREGVRLIREATRLEDRKAAETIAVTVKRVAMQTFGRTRVASLSGQQWLDFLDSTGRTDDFSTEVGEWLTGRRYALSAESSRGSDIDRLAVAASRWIRNHCVASGEDR